MTIALLIDADNVAANRYPEILAHAQSLGEVTIRRAYADTKHLQAWSEIAGLRAFHSGMDKNSSDLQLTVDAMELALRDKVARFVIASSDGGFSHLALKLREYGLEVVGMGGPQAPPRFREACTGFQVLSTVEPSKPAPPKAEPMPVISPVSAPIAKPKATASAIDQEVCRLISERGGKIRMNLLNPEIFRRIGINISTQPEKTWRAYLLKRPHLFAVDPKGPEACVRRLS
ncbi:NYN domain-containing protein [Stagnihabitans tardus]|uniref:NYN domain-containing protein n=1 Tax=Stagnihabitans tardus TaxID=2699202 RepID=A0AAE5BU18_9RHOB|nr:NYN domain-containing protein [Stagnihabitans tardus]NBZ87276.1 NYN domain-containing protein [Stagnihabitans tardus]